ncbi:MAG: Mrp/NBP35 family ATP-binding protein [Planctomycetota bacterium]
MPFDRELVDAALRHVKTPDQTPLNTAVERVTACDGYAAVRLSHASVDAAAGDRLGPQMHEAVRAQATIRGETVHSLRIEFVDHSGTVVHRSVKGGEVPKEAAERLESDLNAGGEPDAVPEPSDGPSGGPSSSSPEASGRATAQQGASGLPGVQHVIAVGAGKGGVGKSTVAVNLAVGLARRGHAVGLMDGDIYGPSLPTMLGLGALEMNVRGNMIQPFLVHGVKSATIGKMVEPDKPLIWRGPMAHGAFKQLAEQTEWGELDYLVIDLPPGTGDVPLTMAQLLQLSGAVIVCTPQRVAQDDAVRAVRMFQQLGVDILGVVENMSYFVGDDEKVYDIFGRGGAELMAQRLGLPFLGGVPINTALRANSDAGDPSANFEPATAGGDGLPRSFDDLAQNLESQVALASLRQGKSKPKLTIS